jgi:ATP:ADP antiporter, AAA family
MTTTSHPSPERDTPRLRDQPLAYVLRLFGDVRPGEAATVLLLSLNVFLLLTAYYLLKVAREPLILLHGGAEMKSYASVGQSILLVFVAGAYSWLGARVNRTMLITGVTLFFAANLLVFWALGTRGVQLGIPFFLWVGIFNLVTIAQFWSFAADIYTDDQGKRLFPIVGIGSSIGAVSGATIAAPLIRHGSPFLLMLVAAAVLVSTLLLTHLIQHREVGRAAKAGAPADDDVPLGRHNAFGLVLRDRYLLLLAVLIFVLNTVTKTGDYVLDRLLVAQASTEAHALGITASAYIGQFKARYFEWINILGVVLQSFFVSRIIKYAGLRVALVLIPLASLGGYGVGLAVPIISVLFVGRVMESSLDYSLSNTTRQALWLVTSREAKYKAKQVIDTFVVRAGDAISAGLVWVGTLVAAGPRAFLLVNVGLSAVWAVTAWRLGQARAHKDESTATAV